MRGVSKSADEAHAGQNAGKQPGGGSHLE
jgi:hypothetical protein